MDVKNHPAHHVSADVRYRKTLEEIGNLVGGPTMSYAPNIERQELLKRIEKISALVPKGLGLAQK